MKFGARSGLWVALLLLCCAWSTSVHATGMMGHIYCSQLALEQMPEGPIKSLMVSRTDLWENGSYFPDSGYAANDPYGELTHWSSFTEGYLRWIRENYDPPYDKAEAADHVAVLLGAASHGMSDQIFDILFWDRVAAIDGDASELDNGIDGWLVADRQRKADDAVYLDPMALSSVVDLHLNHAVSPSVIRSGMETAIQGQKVIELLVAPADEFTALMPWGRENYLNPAVAGAYPWMAPLIAAYWRNIWRRLHEDYSLDELVLGVDPPVGTRVALSKDRLESYVTFFVGHGVDPGSVNDDSVYVLDADGQRVPTRLRTRGDQWVGTIQVQPKQNWGAKRDFTLVVDGLMTLNGIAMDSPYTYDFSSACEEGDRSCEPLPEPSPTAEGCTVRGARKQGAWWLGLVAAFLLFARRTVGLRDDRCGIRDK